jgi:tetratricopeptide (TPR) repeat protein
MGIPTDASEFFVAGGTLHPDAPSYVERPADDELFDRALAGEFCYVLTPRQMGKSSLMTRTARRLEERGIHTAIIDLTGIGAGVSAEQWYLGLIARLRSQLGLSVDPDAWWAERGSLSEVQRFTDFLHDVVLADIKGPVVIFIDEIDTTLSLDFSDDFFAAIRFTYNARASDPAYNRLTFVLLGVAAPADLIKDPGRTPFNIGQGIDLCEFSREDAQVLQRGLQAVLPEQGEAIFARIYHWTNGHPYLTQKLCLAAAKAGDGRWSDERVDKLVESLFLSEQVRREENLQFVRDKILNHPQRRQLLALYRKVYGRRRVGEDERSLMQNQLKLSGLVKAEGGYLHVRNEIYRRAFSLAWVRENTAINWAPIVAGTAVFAALLAISLVLYNAWIGVQFQDCVANFYQASTPGEQLATLARISRLRSPFDTTDYEYRAREMFLHELTGEEQLALFNVEGVEESDLMVVTRGLYVVLADVDGTDNTGVLLEAMARALDRLCRTEGADELREEIDSWRKGRELARQTLYNEALDTYNRAIALNGENPATLYERAQVLAQLSRYQEALDDLDGVMAIARNAPIDPTPTPTQPASRAAIVALTPTADIPAIKTRAPGIALSTIETHLSATPAIAPPLLPGSSEVSESAPGTLPVISQFATFGQVAGAVENLIDTSPGLLDALARAPDSEYANLRDGLGLTDVVSMFIIDQPQHLDPEQEHAQVGGRLAYSDEVPLSEMCVVVYAGAVRPQQGRIWRRSSVPCEARIARQWALSSDCVTFPVEYSEFSLIAILVKVDEAQYLPIFLLRDPSELRSFLYEYVYPRCDNAISCNSISPLFEVRRLPLPEAPTLASSTFMPTPIKDPTGTRTFRPTPTEMPPSTPTPTVAPAWVPTVVPTPMPPVYPSPELMGLDIIRCSLTLHWSWARQLAEDEYFSLRVGIGAPGESRTWTKETQYALMIMEPGEYVWEVAICRGDPETHVCNQLAVSQRGSFSFAGCGKDRP